MGVIDFGVDSAAKTFAENKVLRKMLKINNKIRFNLETLGLEEKSFFGYYFNL